MLLFFLFFCIVFSDTGLVWKHSVDLPVYETCQIMQTEQKVFAGMLYEHGGDIDKAEFFNFSSSTPLFESVCHYGMVAVSRKSDIMACVQFDTVEKILTLFVWKGTQHEKPHYSVVVEGIIFPADYPSVVISEGGEAIGVFGYGPNNTILAVYSPENSKAVAVWKSDDGTLARARHLDVSKDGKLFAFHSIVWHGKEIDPRIVVFDVESKSERYSQHVYYNTNGLGLSPDGQYISYGFEDYGLYKWDENTYQQVYHDKTPHDFVFYQSFVSNSGNMLLGLDYLAGNRPELLYFDPKGQLLWEYDYDLATMPDALMMLSPTEDFKYFAVGTWGSQQETNPQIRVFETDQKEEVKPIFEYVSDGSIFCVDLARNGDDQSKLNLVAGGKHVHASVAGNGGDLYFFEIDT